MQKTKTHDSYRRSRNALRRCFYALVFVMFTCTLSQAKVEVAVAAPFSCSGPAVFYQTQVTIGTQLYALDTTTATYTTVGSNSEGINGIGYNSIDNYIYGYITSAGDPDRNNFVRLHNDGSAELLGVPTGLTENSAVQGDFDHSGNHYQVVGTPGNYELAITTLTPTLSVSYVALTGSVLAVNDLVYQDGKLYGLTYTSLMEIDIDTNTSVVKTLSSPLPNNVYGAGWAAAGGELYFSNNTSGTIYQIVDYDTADPTGIPVLSTSQTAFGNDGASCSLAQTTIEPIEAVDDTNSTLPGTPVSGNVLPNDAGQDITVTGYTQPGNGTVTINPDGSYTYTPNAGFTGTDSFTYTITDANDNTTTATVRITVAAAPEEVNEDELADTGDSLVWAGLASVGSLAVLLGARRRRAYALSRK